MNTLHCCYPGPTWGAFHSDTPSRFPKYRLIFLELPSLRFRKVGALPTLGNPPLCNVRVTLLCHLLQHPVDPFALNRPRGSHYIHSICGTFFWRASTMNLKLLSLFEREGRGLGPLSVSFLIRTSGKEFHSQAGSPRGVPDLGKIPAFSVFF